MEPLQPNAVIRGSYRLEKLIGRGGLGEVWLASDVRLARWVAIKVLTRMDSGEAMTNRFAREARVIAQLSHPSIVSVYDVGREADTRYIVMEFVNGPDLQALINKGQIRIGWGLRIARQVAKALSYAHERGIIHRDVKPSNIIVGASGESAKLTDFGLAKVFTDTETISLAGTPAYMPPEQLTGTIGPEVDVYSLGATLYHLFTGCFPYSSAALYDLATKGVDSQPVPPNEIRPEIPKRLSDVVLSMLEIAPEDRISLTEVMQVIDELCEKIPFPEGKNVEEVALERPHKPEKSGIPKKATISQVELQHTPTGFFDSATFPKTKFFEDDSVRYTKIQETLDFYRKHLHEEYQSLLKQATITYWLWLACVTLGFVTLIAGVGMMLAGRVTEGVATAASTIMVYFIQRIFQQREDHYRSQAKTKNTHLEYGNQWLLIIQSIDSIDDPMERARRQARLIDVLTDKLITEKIM